MEDMEIDQIVDVPDTPDRFTASYVARKYVGCPDVMDEKYVNEKRERGCPVAETGKNKSFAFQPLKNSSSDGMTNCSNFISVSPLKKSYLSHNAPIIRKAQNDKVFGHDTTHSNVPEKTEKGKAICTTFPSKSSSHGSVAILDLTEENRLPQQLKTDFSNHGSKINATEDKKDIKESIRSSCSPLIPGSSNTSSNAFKGKCKIDNDRLSRPNVSVDREKTIDISGDSQQKTEKQMSLPPHVLRAPRISGQKRLVRNGCISPHNIARAKQSAEDNGNRTYNVEQRRAGHVISSSTMSPISVNDIVSEERATSRVKGKGILLNSSSSSLHDAGTIYTDSSSPVINKEEANGISHAIRNSFKCSGGMSGWRTTRNHRNIDQSNGHHLRQNNDPGNIISAQYRNGLDRRDTRSSKSSMNVRSPLEECGTLGTSLIISEADQSTGPCRTAHTLTKRQRKHGSTSRNSSEVSYNSETIFLGSSGKSSNLGSSRNTVLDPEVVELLPETRYTNRVSQDLDDINDDDSEARARQVEADEILARELQEQLYHEDSFEVGQIDEHLARELQHEEELLHTSVDSHHTSYPARLSRMTSNRQPRTRSHQNPSNRRRVVPQVPLSNRMSRLRNRTLSRSPVPNISSRGRRLHFPLDMDLDMRLDILEALEDSVGDLSDIGVADDILQAQRDFIDGDYELFLALDENNHQHAGASANQINNLPLSTIQADNFDEVCAICLETPVKGETIRHLPCLHKFHKDCIDPWLRRKTFCPVCKSSIS